MQCEFFQFVLSRNKSTDAGDGLLAISILILKENPLEQLGVISPVCLLNYMVKAIPKISRDLVYCNRITTK